jgi:pro-apoptotic serine protease NMA111
LHAVAGKLARRIPQPKDPEMLAPLLAVTLAAAPAQWEATLEKVVDAVVAIRTTTPRSFDTKGASNGVATGFVVDAERGIILTNRHVAKPGPVVAEAVFQDHEEVELRAIYRDPVHDFGFFAFDPAAVEYQDVVELALAPDAARVGAEIRVVGNDAGEKLSILEGILARTDRSAPWYGLGRFNDFNTFYFQAASGTSGGSSGSPVIDIEGRVVALNAGSKSRSAASFYLPLDRVVRALEAIQAGEPVTRGTLQTGFEHRPFDELERLGLRAETQAAVRAEFPEGTGLLVVDRALIGGPASGQLEAGDVLVRLDGALIDSFIPLEATLDDGVGTTVTLGIERRGEAMDVPLIVQDLHSISPASYLEVSGAVLHDLSYQKARTYNVPIGGVYVASQGTMLEGGGVPYASVIEAVGETPTPDLDAFEAALAVLGHGARVQVVYRTLGDWRRRQVAVVEIDRRWHASQRCDRDDVDGWWDCRPLADPPPPVEAPSGTASLPPAPGKVSAKLAPSLVWVQYDVPFRIDGSMGSSFLGTGVIVDAERGLVLVDRDTVTVPLGDVTLTFGGSLEIPGRVEWLHPVHDYAFVRFDPALIGDTPIQSATFIDRPAKPGEELFAVGLTRSLALAESTAKVTRVDSFAAETASPPRYRQYNVDVVEVPGGMPIVGGVLADKKGRIVAHYVAQSTGSGKKRRSVMVGLPSEVILDALEPLRRGEVPKLRALGVELGRVSLVDARNRGVDEARVQGLAKAGGQRPGALVVFRREAGTPAAELLLEGDVIVAVNGEPAAFVRQVEEAGFAESVQLSVVRQGTSLELDVPTTMLDGRGTDRLLFWAGMLLQRPHHAIAAQEGLERDGVYISLWWNGSPAHRYGIWATRRIVEVDGKPVLDLDAFLAAVQHLKHRDTVQLKTIDLDGGEEAETLKLDLHYWPTAELNWTEDGWVRTEL